MRSIKTKLCLGITILIGVIIVILWLFQIVFLDRFYVNYVLGQVISQADNTIDQIEKIDSITDDSIKEIMQNWEEYIYEKQLCVQIIDQNGTIQYQVSNSHNADTQNVMPAVLDDAVNSVYQSALNGNKTSVSVTHPKFGFDFIVTGIPIKMSDQIRGVMIIGVPMSAVDDTIDILKQQLSVITLILIAISIIISCYLSKMFVDPVSKIIMQAEAFAEGKYKVRIDEPSKDELGKLAIRMNEMGESLLSNEILQKELIANVSHELRTPLTIIRGYAEAIRDITGDQPEKRNKQIEIIIKESDRLGHMVEDVLDLSRLQSGVVTPDLKPFSIREMLQEIKDHFELEQSGRHMELDIPYQENLMLIGDYERIQQVFYNLIGNAFRHAGEDRKVIAAVSKVSNQKARIEVKDHGEGIDPEDIPHVFERYYKGKRKNGQKREGTGLGLAISKSIFEMHHAQYGIHSVVGQGTSFWFELEIADSIAKGNEV